MASRRPWATHSVAADWVPAVTAGITAAAALGGQAIAGLFQGRNQERAEARQRRDRAAEVLAEVRAFLVDSSPDRLGFNASPEGSPEVLRELGERHDRIRIPLLTLAGSHPSPNIRRLAQQLEVEMANMLHMAGWSSATCSVTGTRGRLGIRPTSTTRRRWVCSTSSWTRSRSWRRAGQSAAGCSGAVERFRAARQRVSQTGPAEPRRDPRRLSIVQKDSEDALVETSNLRSSDYESVPHRPSDGT